MSRGKLFREKYLGDFMALNFHRGYSPEENYLGVTVSGQLFSGELGRGNCSGSKSLGSSCPVGNFMGGNCPEASSPGQNVWIPFFLWCILTLDSNKTVFLSFYKKEHFGFQKLRISFSEILFQKKPLNASQILSF